jgi:transcriptional regulator with AAA-type ATPase domain
MSIDLSPLDGALARHGELASAWSAAYARALDGAWRIAPDDLEEILDRELGRLIPNGADREEQHAALGATASCLLSRGVPLAHALAVSAAWHDALREIVGDPLPARVAATAVELEALRARIYSRIYLKSDRTAPPSCTPPLAVLRPKAHAARPCTSATAEIIGESAPMKRLREAIAVAAQGARSVLVTGESGSGKELVARAIHAAAGGERAKLVAVNCAALPAHLVESELFGHARGAFTGASGEYAGLFRSASGGTLFLDELTEMSRELQAKLLRVLEERTIRPVGSLSEVAVDVRIVASTNHDPLKAVERGLLRADLYYRLQAFTLHVPPLRERRSDIPLLCDHFLRTFCQRRCGCIYGISERAMRVLSEAELPGNVRELRNAIEHAVTTGQSGLIQVEDLPASISGGAPCEGPELASELPSLAQAEATLIRATLEQFRGNKLRAAQSLGISRHKLYDRLQKLGLG